ncbi:hypothetical protein T751_00156 [Klebsiella phage T751]|nr:hypothetical protein K751_00002 [Klebsiella phage K751]URG13718.1 hypothetical protein T751_00156 [Klebsiella phage T751]URG18038.1 hypothetical protein T765_00200 [Klebsiella phage T765]
MEIEESIDYSELYRLDDSGNPIFKEGLSGSWLALAQEHYLSSLKEQKSEG